MTLRSHRDLVRSCWGMALLMHPLVRWSKCKLQQCPFQRTVQRRALRIRTHQQPLAPSIMRRSPLHCLTPRHPKLR